MSNKSNYKTSRKYKCPFCDQRMTRMELVDHVDKKHAEMIPEGYSAARTVYDSINGKDYGICMICKSKVYEWNDKISRYYNLCKNPKCRQTVREIALERHMRVYNKPTLLNDAEHQEKMLANRKISGSYTFRDGGKITYTGSYEKKALEFLDTVLEIPSKDIQAPGPVLEYEFDGEKHQWITDIYYIPANLIIEVKDGGSNPNNRSMVSYRDKQIAKEKMITDLGTFNYIRLTNNNFAQLLNIFADIKNEALEETDGKPVSKKVHINEEVGGLPPHRPPEAYIVPYGMNNTFSGFAYGDSNIGDNLAVIDSDMRVNLIDKESFNEEYDIGFPLYYEGVDIKEKSIQILEDLRSGNKVNSYLHFAEMLCGRKLHRWEEILLSEHFKYYSKEKEDFVNTLIENAVLREAEGLMSNNSDIVKTIENVFIHQTPSGYYASTSGDFNMASEYFSDIESLEASGIISIMNDMYNKNANGGVDNA